MKEIGDSAIRLGRARMTEKRERDRKRDARVGTVGGSRNEKKKPLTFLPTPGAVDECPSLTETGHFQEQPASGVSINYVESRLSVT